ncbi:MAG: phospholipase A [Gammaproteobacteria bacterium]|nr:phospholipase A [Gammaproteobacteria bacterium]MDH5653192.1 phospholipase A [Gammaproteobacteria bacterium]
MKLFTTILVLCLFMTLSRYSLAEEPEVALQKEELKSIFRECNIHINQIKRRFCLEDKSRYTPFSLLPHKPNYFLFSNNKDLHQENPALQDTEIKFQISFKSQIMTGYDRQLRLYAAYTQLSLWQMFNSHQSSPFRESNYEPELMLYWLIDQPLYGDWSLELINFGIWKHQSNGQPEATSRSWDRNYVQLTFANHPFYFDVIAWHRITEPLKAFPGDPIGDDNPDIEKYLGHGELRLMYHTGRSMIGIMHRNSLGNTHRKTWELSYSLPVDDRNRLRVYFQYFKGYGESLIDYNVERERFGIGVMLSEWL